MKIDDICKMWAEDSSIDDAQIVEESIKAVKMHSKYYDIFIKEKLILTNLELDLNKLQLLKYEYYTGDIDKQTLDEQGWKPNKKLILKTDIAKYLDADDDIIKLKLRVAVQKEKVAMLKDIISSINQRTFHIKNIIESRKFMSGVY